MVSLKVPNEIMKRFGFTSDEAPRLELTGRGWVFTRYCAGKGMSKTIEPADDSDVIVTLLYNLEEALSPRDVEKRFERIGRMFTKLQKEVNDGT